MVIMTWDGLFGYPTAIRNPQRTLENAEWNTLTEDATFCGIEYAAGSRYKFFETEDFGWVVFSPDSRTPSGEVPTRRIHKN